MKLKDMISGIKYVVTVPDKDGNLEEGEVLTILYPDKSILNHNLGAWLNYEDWKDIDCEIEPRDLENEITLMEKKLEILKGQREK
jgi:hypothetical protein